MNNTISILDLYNTTKATTANAESADISKLRAYSEAGEEEPDIPTGELGPDGPVVEEGGEEMEVSDDTGFDDTGFDEGVLTGIIGLDEYVTQYAFMSTISPTLPSQQFSPPYTADFEWWSKYAAYGFYDGYYNGSSSSTAEKRFYNYVEKYNSGTNIVLTDRNAMWTPHHSF